MSTAVRTAKQKPMHVGRSQEHFCMCFRDGKKLMRFELTRKQAESLVERLNSELHGTASVHREPQPDEERWRDPEIM